MMESGSMLQEMVKDNKSGLTALSMKVNERITELVEKVS